jgi:hypothetical protein
MKYWFIAAFDTEARKWSFQADTTYTDFDQILEDFLRWKGQGQSVRLQYCTIDEARAGTLDT